VIYTRKTDEFIPLYKRAEIANTNKADLFISIHANGNPNTSVYGTETLVLGLHRAGENFEVAKKENAVIQLEDDYHARYEGYDPNSPESFIMFSLMQNLYFDLSGLVQDQFRERAGRTDRGVKQQGLLVLAQTSMPGILIETGFITNPEEEKFLMSEQGQDYIASAIFRAFKDYKRITESKASFAVASRGSKPATDSNTSGTGMTTVNEPAPPVPVQKSAPMVEFKVQIAASSKSIPVNSRVFKGLAGVTEYKFGKMYKYAVGGSNTFPDIITFSKKIKEKFPDAFIIAVKDSVVIPLDQALQESAQKNSN
jgi:N-acetylmuramoyl-L-alanine amidase